MTEPQPDVGAGPSTPSGGIRRTARGPVTLGQLQRDTGMTRTRVRRCVAALRAQDLIANTDRGPVPLVRPLTLAYAATAIPTTKETS